MVAVMLQKIPSFYSTYSKKSLLTSTNRYQKYIVSKEYSIARHDDKVCFLHKCRYHIIRTRNNKKLLQQLNAPSFTYQHVGCLYTLFKYRFSGKIVVKSGQIFDNVQRAVLFNH